MASTPELSLECRLREFLMRVSQMKHLGHNEFPFEDVSKDDTDAAGCGGSAGSRYPRSNQLPMALACGQVRIAAFSPLQSISPLRGDF